MGKKYFANSKTLRTFAKVHAKNCLKTFVVSVFFYAQILATNNKLGYQIPAYYTTAKYVMVLGGTGGDSLSYIYILTNFLTQMPRAKKIESNVNNSSFTSTLTERNTVSIEAFNIEKNAKNRAYAFILHHELLNAFSEFCKATANVQDPHELCLTLLNEKL